MEDKYPLALPEGTVLAGQYIIQKVLGQGGFGITYMAMDHQTNQKVAVKEFFPDALATRTQNTVSSYPGERTDSFQYGKSCFLQEAETLAAFIGNENIVRIHSYFEENGTAYFVMDFVEGISFDEYIEQRGGKVSYEDAERVLLPIIDALALVHSKGIVHRDVTPDNIYITNDGTVKLLDFGAARYSLGDKSRSLDVVLKHGFAPKEQYTRHGRQGPFTDVYTVGASFYFAITGKRPPDSIDRLEEDDLVPPSSLGVDIPAPKEDAILKAMSVQPGERFQTMEQFKYALSGGQSAAQGAVNQRIFTETQPIAQPGVQPVSEAPQPVAQSASIAPQSVGAAPQPVAQPGVKTGSPMPQPGKSGKKVAFIAAAAVIVAVLGITVTVWALAGRDDDDIAAYADRRSKWKDSSEEDAPAGTSRSSRESESASESSETSKPSESSKPSETSKPSESSKPSETQKPAVQPGDEYEEILGNSVDNIKNSNMIAAYENGAICYFNGKGLYEGDGKYLASGAAPISLSVIGDNIYYVDLLDGKAYRVKKGDSEPKAILGTKDRKYLAFYVSQSYYFGVTDDGRFFRWNISEGKTTGSTQVKSEKHVMFLNGYVYYVNTKEEGGDVLYRMPTGGDWNAPEEISTYKNDCDVKEICTDGSRLCVLYERPYRDSNDDGVVDSNGIVHCCAVYNAATYEFTKKWLWKVMNENDALAFSHIRAREGYIYYIRMRVDTGSSEYAFDIQRMSLDNGKVETLYTEDDGSYQVVNLWGLSVLRNHVAVSGITEDGKYRLYYMNLDGSDLKIYDYEME